MTKEETEWSWETDKIEEARRALLTHFTAQQNGQITRLVGFVIGLFTLLQLAQTMEDKAFNQIFGYFPNLIHFSMPWEGDVLKTLFLFFGTWVILYFVLRSIFRFGYYGYMTFQIMYVTEDEARASVQDEAKMTKKEPKEFAGREMWALSTATQRRTYDSMRIYYLFPGKWFFSLPGHPNYPNRENIGVVFLMIVSGVFAFLLLLFLW